MLSAQDFQSQLARGLVIRLALDDSVLDDPLVTTRQKFIVVLNYLCPDDPTYFVMATSNVERFTRALHLAPETVSLDHANYQFLNRPTVLDFTSVKPIPLIDLTALNGKGLARIVGHLRDEDLVRCDEVIRRSRFIEPRVVPLILPGGYF